MYAVVQSNNYGAPIHVHLFDTEPAAQTYLQNTWWKFLSREVDESAIEVVERESYAENNYGVVAWANCDKEEWDLVETEDSATD